MSNFIVSPNMGLPVPTPGQDPGPDYANNEQNCFNLIDAHNHSSGKGVPITPSGLNINSDLSIQGNNLTVVKTVNFQAQVSSLSGVAPNLGCVYVAGNELYYNDEAGNVVQITSSGSVNAGAGSITGLPSGTASVTYTSSKYVFQSATVTPATIDVGSVIIRNTTASSNGITVSAPNSLGSNYGLVLPLIPAGTSFVTLDTSGNFSGSIATSKGITASNIADSTITMTQLAAYSTQVLSSSCGNFTSAATSPTAITNLTLSITTKGGPVVLGAVNDGSGNTSNWVIGDSETGISTIYLYRGGSAIQQYAIQSPFSSPASQGSGFLPMLFDVPSAGTYTYALYISNSGTSAGSNFTYFKLFAYEL